MSSPFVQRTRDQAEFVWSRLQRLLTVCAVAILFAMMLLTSFDVVARYVFNSPVRGAFELTEIGLASLIYLALPVATAAGSHIAVELLALPRAGALRQFLELFVRSLIALTFGSIAWQVWHHAEKLTSYGQVTNSLEIPVGLIAYVCSLGAGLCVFAAFAKKSP